MDRRSSQELQLPCRMDMGPKECPCQKWRVKLKVINLAPQQTHICSHFFLVKSTCWRDKNLILLIRSPSCWDFPPIETRRLHLRHRIERAQGSKRAEDAEEAKTGAMGWWKGLSTRCQIHLILIPKIKKKDRKVHPDWCDADYTVLAFQDIMQTYNFNYNYTNGEFMQAISEIEMEIH